MQGPFPFKVVAYAPPTIVYQMKSGEQRSETLSPETQQQMASWQPGWNVKLGFESNQIVHAEPLPPRGQPTPGQPPARAIPSGVPHVMAPLSGTPRQEDYPGLDKFDASIKLVAALMSGGTIPTRELVEQSIKIVNVVWDSTHTIHQPAVPIEPAMPIMSDPVPYVHSTEEQVNIDEDIPW